MTAQPHATPAAMPLSAGDADYDRWSSELHNFLAVRSDLCADPDLLGKFIAMRDHQIVDSDADEISLARRIAKNHPRQVVLITKVDPADPVIEPPALEFR